MRRAVSCCDVIAMISTTMRAGAGAEADDALAAGHQVERAQQRHVDAAPPLHHHRARGRPHGARLDQVRHHL